MCTCVQCVHLSWEFSPTVRTKLASVQYVDPGSKDYNNLCYRSWVQTSHTLHIILHLNIKFEDWIIEQLLQK